LLESIPVALERPRDRKALLQNAEFKRLRNEIIDRLIASKRRPTAALTRRIILPDIEPEDISLSTSRLLVGRGVRARRRRETQAVKVEVEI
jgi:nitrate/nitrite transport system ATP-binding protein